MDDLNFEPAEAPHFIHEEDNNTYEALCGGAIAAFICTTITLMLTIVAFSQGYRGLGVFAATIAAVSVIMGLCLMPKGYMNKE
jgi:hypothetical protein